MGRVAGVGGGAVAEVPGVGVALHVGEDGVGGVGGHTAEVLETKLDAAAYGVDGLVVELGKGEDVAHDGGFFKIARGAGVADEGGTAAVDTGLVAEEFACGVEGDVGAVDIVPAVAEAFGGGEIVAVDYAACP